MKVDGRLYEKTTSHATFNTEPQMHFRTPTIAVYGNLRQAVKMTPPIPALGCTPFLSFHIVNFSPIFRINLHSAIKSFNSVISLSPNFLPLYYIV